MNIKVKVFQIFSGSFQICSFYRASDAREFVKFLKNKQRAEEFRNRKIRYRTSYEHLSEDEIKEIEKNIKVERLA